MAQLLSSSTEAQRHIETALLKYSPGKDAGNLLAYGEFASGLLEVVRAQAPSKTEQQLFQAIASVTPVRADSPVWGSSDDEEEFAAEEDALREARQDAMDAAEAMQPGQLLRGGVPLSAPEIEEAAQKVRTTAHHPSARPPALPPCPHPTNTRPACARVLAARAVQARRYSRRPDAGRPPRRDPGSRQIPRSPARRARSCQESSASRCGWLIVCRLVPRLARGAHQARLKLCPPHAAFISCTHGDL